MDTKQEGEKTCPDHAGAEVRPLRLAEDLLVQLSYHGPGEWELPE